MTATAPPPATATAAPEAPAAPAAPPAPRAPLRALWRRSRWWLLAALVLVLVGTLVAGIPGNSSYDPLDPRSGDPRGTRAVDQLLRQHGIDSRTATSAAELGAALRADDTTVVLTRPAELAYQIGRAHV